MLLLYGYLHFRVIAKILFCGGISIKKSLAEISTMRINLVTFFVSFPLVLGCSRAATSNFFYDNFCNDMIIICLIVYKCTWFYFTTVLYFLFFGWACT